jgi:hypothetical protein|tara:strand:+ start:16028 stop:16492 length:465 start_codon:yes stop_codon:yes gene_type:complete
MKNTLLIMLAIGFSFASFSQATKAPAKAKTAPVKSEKVVAPAKEVKPVTFTNMVIERKDIAKGTDDMFSFEFKNTGNTPVLIQNVQTSCGCTTASKPEAPIAPGKKSEISVKYDTNRVGAFEKTITVTTNVGEPIVLTIKGNVLGEAGTEGQAH